ncbi:hypothetical protein J8L98_14765 [Pseudoalteromonas sp. MMG013]|uniref:hypothetical protein n=1 Tax=Pseudoalteromonas sp. MMG013 TaxID=2822687 RepID=UPI001B386408|nr:hypothetical protein [Pseudoalteromonas sp. MMG013]MBQ4862947.1 hypothetical protein [Pseudoalteromonas sp. MMG013]
MLPPINNNSSVSTTKNGSKQPSNAKKRPASIKAVSAPTTDLTMSSKGKIRRVVFQTLKKKFGEQFSQEAQFIDMVNWVSHKIETSVTTSDKFEEIINSLLSNKR